ncbi:protein SCAI [Selaginella moellendorffii]|uniref:protein SCAI n=1 Tax=Selaginella moellendorffii TaxID=88036 RepID=UPI000D1C8445|nr:protein SCAI [Selaginella moellendorffii]|eukprot:XP_024544213.1 protein SCAI [Selaginella moellendorffii]
MALSVCEEYRALVDKAYNKFSRLRDFPPYGQNKWDFYFRKAFQVYTKLWKFQQDNRQKLVEAGLKRWEIGEIASRIGQLYYIYYLRTSDATFVKESYIFYEAILSREYFKEPGKDITLANKQLRYFARFIVICLLLNRWDMVNRLVRQLHILVEDYSSSFQNSDVKEWKTVTQEIVRFLKADSLAELSRPIRYISALDGQVSSFPSVSKLEGHKALRLKNAVLVSYFHNEVKFSELTLDNFRMLQCLEWEPSGSFYRMKSATDSNAGGLLAQDIADPTLPANPHKYILYRPNIHQLLMVLATACEEVPPDSAVLLYLSAAGRSRPGSHDRSGVSNQFSKEASSTDSSPDRSDALLEETPVSAGSPRRRVDGSTGLSLGRRGSNVYPGDLLPFTRRPLFIVVDSDASNIFESLCGDERGEPVVLLLSPTAKPYTAKHPGTGSTFTFFLTAPLQALCQMTNVRVTELQQGSYEQAEKMVSSTLLELGNLLASSGSLNVAWGRVLGDPFLRQLLFRFVFARACYSLHRLYVGKSEYYPRCLPPLPEEVLPRSRVVELSVLQVARLLCVADQFFFSENGS